MADDAQLTSFHALPPALLRHRFVNQLAQLREKVLRPQPLPLPLPLPVTLTPSPTCHPYPYPTPTPTPDQVFQQAHRPKSVAGTCLTGRELLAALRACTAALNARWDPALYLPISPYAPPYISLCTSLYLPMYLDIFPYIS